MIRIERRIIFENQSHQTKAGKKLNDFDVFMLFYTPMVVKWKPIKVL